MEGWKGGRACLLGGTLFRCCDLLAHAFYAWRGPLCRAARQVVQAGPSMQGFLDNLNMFKVGHMPRCRCHCVPPSVPRATR